MRRYAPLLSVLVLAVAPLLMGMDGDASAALVPAVVVVANAAATWIASRNAVRGELAKLRADLDAHVSARGLHLHARSGDVVALPFGKPTTGA